MPSHIEMLGWRGRPKLIRDAVLIKNMTLFNLNEDIVLDITVKHLHSWSGRSSDGYRGDMYTNSDLIWAPPYSEMLRKAFLLCERGLERLILGILERFHPQYCIADFFDGSTKKWQGECFTGPCQWKGHFFSFFVCWCSTPFSQSNCIGLFTFITWLFSRWFLIFYWLFSTPYPFNVLHGCSLCLEGSILFSKKIVKWTGYLNVLSLGKSSVQLIFSSNVSLSMYG